MFPWVKEQITEFWRNRKDSRMAVRQSLNLISVEQRRTSPNQDPSQASSSSSEFARVISLEGQVHSVVMRPDFTVDKLKSIALKHFYGDEGVKSSAKYYLVHVSKCTKLTGEHTVKDAEISNADELLLVESIKMLDKEKQIQDLMGPTIEEIEKATDGLELRNPSRVVPSVKCPENNEIRKILITLVRASAKILSNTPSADICYQVLRERLEDRCKPPKDVKALKYLMDMGYSERKAIRALQISSTSTTRALDWLLDHEEDSDDEDLELPIIDLEADPDLPGPSSGRRKSLKEAWQDLFKGSPGKSDGNLVRVVESLLQSFRQYRKLEFKPSVKLIELLKEMGFEEDDIVEALKITGNNQSNACEWLIGERRESLQDLDQGLDLDGQIYKAIMSNPQIQLSLRNPKMLLAYLLMLETPALMSAWRSDSEVSPIINQIYKTYHMEKHAIHLNRFDNS